MATPIQYIPQPIFSNVGVLQQQLAQDQARHDQAMANQLAMEDQFAQVPTHPTDIPVKNRVLGDFQNKVQDVVERYGGDYGAAAKDIARLTSRTRQNPFFQLAPERRRLAEEQRRRQQELGPYAITAQDVTAMPLQDPETGEWIDPSRLSSKVLDERLYLQQLQEDHKYLPKRVKEGSWRRDPNFPQILQRTRYKGILPNEEQAYAEQFYQELASDPDLPDETARRMASNFAHQLVLGTDTETRIDSSYGKDFGEMDNPYLNVIGLGAHPLDKDNMADTAKSYARMTGGDRSVFDASPNAMPGTSKFLSKTGNPVVNLTLDKLVEDNPEIKSYQRNLLGEDNTVFVPGAGNINLKNRFGIGNDEMKSIVAKAENRQKQQASEWESYRESGLGEWWVARPITEIAGRLGEFATNSFINNVRQVTEETLRKRNPDISPVQVENIADAVTKQYSNRASEANETIHNAWRNEVNVDELEDLLNFTTLDATKKGVDTQLSRIGNISDTFLTAENFEFLTGEHAEESPEEILEQYGNEVPEIVGIGGDTENGPLFVVRDKAGNKSIAKLNTRYDNVASLANAFGRPDLAQASVEQEYRKIFEDGSELPNGGIYRKSPSGRHVLQIDEGTVLTNEEVANIKKDLSEQGYELNLEIPDGYPEQPYEFNTITSLLEFKQNFLNNAGVRQ